MYGKFIIKSTSQLFFKVVLSWKMYQHIILAQFYVKIYSHQHQYGVSCRTWDNDTTASNVWLFLTRTNGRSPITLHGKHDESVAIWLQGCWAVCIAGLVGLPRRRRVLCRVPLIVGLDFRTVDLSSLFNNRRESEHFDGGFVLLLWVFCVLLFPAKGLT